MFFKTVNLVLFMFLVIPVGWLDQQVEAIKEEAFASSTRKTRRSQWNRYRQFTEQWKLPFVPIEPINVCRFLYEISPGLCYGTLNNYVSGLNLLSKLNNGCDLRLDFGIHLMLMGLKRIKGDTVKPIDPLSPLDLWNIFQQVNLQNHTELSVWVGALFCFRTLLRKCHIFPSPDLDSHLLCRKDVQYETWGFIANVPTSKTNQFCQRVFQLPVTYLNSELCIASQLKRYWAMFGGNDNWPVVSSKNGSPISYNVVLKNLKSWCRCANIQKDIGFHSLRRGAASYMYSLGFSIHDIKVEGDWQSLAVLLYLSTAMDRRISIDKQISESLSQMFDN